MTLTRRSYFLGAAAFFAAVVPSAATLAQDAPVKEYDLKAEALLQKAANRMQAMQALSGQVKTIISTPASGTTPARELRYVNTFRMQRPNMVFQELEVQRKGSDGNWTTHPYMTFVGDGKTGAAFTHSSKTYRKLEVTTEALSHSYALNFPEFFVSTVSDAQQARDNKASGRLVSLQIAPDETFGGVLCSVVEEKNTTSKTDTTKVSTTKIYIGKQDTILRGYHHTEPPSQSGVEGATTDTIVGEVEARDKIPASVFAVNLTGYKEYVAPSAAKRPDLLAAGTTAPDFTAYDKNGNAVKLSDFKGKIVVLDFWATWCGPCMKSFPGTNTVAKEKADKGVVVLAVNVWDKKEAFDKWLPLHPEYAPIRFVIDTTPGKGQDVATKQYRVWGIPTQYVIDRNGKIAASLIYRPAAELEAAIAQADAAQTPVVQK